MSFLIAEFGIFWLDQIVETADPNQKLEMDPRLCSLINWQIHRQSTFFCEYNGRFESKSTKRLPKTGRVTKCNSADDKSDLSQQIRKFRKSEMAIKVRCKNCNAGFQAKDELAGRRVKCPKCKEPLKIKAPEKKRQPVAAANHNPLLDLLDEQNVRSAARGPVCENCAAELSPGAIVCVECGFNAETGMMLKTEAYDDDFDAQAADSSMSDAERIMAKAEKDIEDMPVTSEGQNFGDGAESYLIAVVMGVIGIGLIAISLVIIFTMEQITEHVASSAVSMMAAILLYVAMGIWITIVALVSKKSQGIASVCTAFLWCVVFGFMQGKQMIVPTIILLISLLIGLASGAYTYYNGFVPGVEV